MKTIITHAISIFTIILLAGRIAVAQQIVTIAPSLTVCPGTQNVEVPISVENLSGVCSISLSLEFNNANVSYVSYTANPVLTENGAMLLVNCPSPFNKVKAAFFSLTPISLPNDAVLFTFTFNVTGSSGLTWDIYTPGACQYADYDAQPLPSTFIDGAIQAFVPDAYFNSTSQICEGENATLSFDFIQGTPPFVFVYNDGVNPDITDTAYSSDFQITQPLTETTTWTLISITDATGCTNEQVNKSATTYVLPLAEIFNVSGGGTRCENGEALSVTLDGSQSGLIYTLYLDGNSTFSWQYGTGDPLLFQGLTAAGTYTIIAHNDCGDQIMNSSASIVVLPLPQVNFPPLTPICYLIEPFLLSGATPEGGIYSGDGVENGYFHSEYYGPGTYMITYTYTDADGCINSAVQTLEVLSLPAVYFEPLPPICGNSDSLLLVGEPAGGLFTGDGVIDGYFYPDLAGPGVHVLTYTYTDNEGCSNSMTQEASVFPLPLVTLTPVDDMCANASPGELSGTPEGGWFEGPGVIGNFFYPEIATAGTWTLSYYFTNEYGCTQFASDEVTIMPVPVVNIEAIGPFCLNASPVELTGTPAGGAFSGEGVQNGLFYPEVAGYGIWPVIYFYTDDNGCSSSNGTDVTVYSLPEVYFYPVDPVCVAGEPVTLVGWPEGGVFSGPGIVNNLFYPDQAGEGTFVLVYTYTDEQNCSNTSVQEITVYGAPQADFQLPAMVCVNNDLFELFPSPEGGWFEGDGMSYNWFNPEEAGTGIHTITYHYTDNNGCSAIIAHDINVLPLTQLYFDAVQALCADGSAVALSATPIGGEFSGTGVVDGMFNPAEAGPGVWPVTYTYTNAEGCTSSETIYITVNEIPSPYFAPLDPVCIDASPVELYGWPEGGIFSGTGVENNLFYPSIAGIGTFTLQYTYTSEAGCTAFATQDITVTEGATAEFNLPENICFSSEAIELIGIPEGGWFDGNGVYGNWFYPAEAGIGTWTITYHYQDNTCTAEVSHDITVNDEPVINFPEVGPFCYTEDPISLNATPEGGIYSGTGIVDNTFSPSLAGPGYWELTYTVTNENGCSAMASIWVTVNDIPQVAIYGPENICINAEPVEIIGYPEGGTFFGDGMEGNYFNPSSLIPGNYIVTYVYSDENGCSNTASLPIVVNDLTPIVIDPVSPLCVNNDEILLTATPEGGYFSGTEVWNNYFYPALAGTGDFIITYNYTNAEGCVTTAEITVTVNPVTALTFEPMPDVCLNAPPVELIAYPIGGTFTGNGVEGSLFYPSLAGLGTTEITYTYLNDYNCTSFLTQTINVNNAVEIIFDPIPDLCQNGGIIELSAFPVGGTFSGEGVVGNTFDPSLTGPGTFMITYNYMSNEACEGSAVQNITVLPLTDLVFDPIPPVCLTAEPFLLSAYPQGGTFTGEGVINNFFYPENAGVGSWIITYTYINEWGCLSELTQTIVVNPVTQATLDPVSPLCEYSGPVTLTANPDGGTFSGNGVVDNEFNPQLAGIGTWVVTYSYTNEFGCVYSASISIEVVPAPQVGIYPVDPVCENTQAFTPGAYPDGGIFSGPGIENNVFYPSLAGVGQWIITYTYTDPYGCSSTASTAITVSYASDVIIGSVGPFCFNADPVQLSGSPIGGVFSGPGVSGDMFYPSQLTAGVYTISYSWDENGCGGTASTDVVIYPQLFANAGDDVTILEGAGTTLSATAGGGIEPYSYSWTPDNSLDDPASQNPVANPLVTTIYSLIITDAAGCTATDEVTVYVTVIQDDIQGTLTYKNLPETPLNNCLITLYHNGSEVANTLTDDNGHYSFMNLPFGDYSLSAQTNKPWGGGNATDGLLMLKHFTGTIPLTGLNLLAGEITGEGVINAHDALNTMRRFVSLLPDYSPIGDWVFEQPELTIDGFTPQNINFHGLCMSDVNGDYLPPFIKPEPSISMINKGSVSPSKGNLTIPVFTEQDLSIGALSLIFEVPSGSQVNDVIFNGSHENLIYKQIGDEIRIAWCSLIPVSLKAGDRLFSLSVSNIHPGVELSLKLEGSSSLADENALTMKDIVFSSPLITGNASELTLSNYPNPFYTSTQINYSLPCDGKVSITVYNLVGKKVTELIHADQVKGNYQLSYDGSALSPGTYIYRIELSNTSEILQQSRTMNLVK